MSEDENRTLDKFEKIRRSMVQAGIPVAFTQIGTVINPTAGGIN